jgi:hypothetical protein
MSLFNLVSITSDHEFWEYLWNKLDNILHKLVMKLEQAPSVVLILTIITLLHVHPNTNIILEPFLLVTGKFVLFKLKIS